MSPEETRFLGESFSADSGKGGSGGGGSRCIVNSTPGFVKTHRRSFTSKEPSADEGKAGAPVTGGTTAPDAAPVADGTTAPDAAPVADGSDVIWFYNEKHYGDRHHLRVQSRVRRNTEEDKPVRRIPASESGDEHSLHIVATLLPTPGRKAWFFNLVFPVSLSGWGLLCAGSIINPESLDSSFLTSVVPIAVAAVTIYFAVFQEESYIAGRLCRNATRLVVCCSAVDCVIAVLFVMNVTSETVITLVGAVSTAALFAVYRWRRAGLKGKCDPPQLGNRAPETKENAEGK